MSLSSLARLTVLTLSLGAFSVSAVTLSGCDSKDDETEEAEEKSEKKKKRKKKKEKKVIEKLETFKGSKTGDEAYDSRLLGNKAYAAKMDSPLARPNPVPPTLTDVLIEDMRLIAKVDLKIPKSDTPFTKEQIEKLIAFYVDTEPGKIRGYRPTTHKEFIVSLKEDERKRLADELVAHLKKNKGYAKAVLIPEHEKGK